MTIPFNTTLGQFRWVALFEGISFLLLLFIAMPLKYALDMPLAVRYIGMVHGLLFVGYIILLYMVWQEHKWAIGKVLTAFIASLLPFGTLWFDKRLRNEMA